MSTANLNHEELEISNSNDDIVIVQALSQIPGGRTLDCSSLPAGQTVIKAGHVLIEATETKSVSPLPISDGAYSNLPQGSRYIGVLKKSISRRVPQAAIVTAGQVNSKAGPAPITDAIRAGLPRIEWLF